MGTQLTNKRIVGVGLLLFSAVLLGVGIHHMVATGTCSSTGYSANYGPVPTCPSGTGWWFAFVFGGIIGSLVGALLAGSIGLVFAGIFGAIGVGALSLVLDAHAHGGTKVFGAVFGGCFALVGVAAGIAVISSAIGALKSAGTRPSAAPQPARGTSAFGTPDATSAFGQPSKDADPIISAYHASRDAATTAPAPAVGATGSRGATAPLVTPLNLVAGLQAAQRAASGAAVDELSKLAELHRQGALTDDEFASAKSKLLGEM